MPQYQDQLLRNVEIVNHPARIVSLVPSQTELLFNLGLDESVVGITKFCIHPKQWRKTKTIVGGTKNFHVEKIAALQPDLIIGNKEENEELGLLHLMENFPVWVSDIRDLNGALDMIHSIGAITNRRAESQLMLNRIRAGFQSIVPVKASLRVVYLIWNEPMMSINGDTFIHDMLSKLGFENICAEHKTSRYPLISHEELAGLNPDCIFLSSEPFPFKDEHLQKFRALYSEARVFLVNGEMFSWYGSRLLLSPFYFRSLTDLM